MKGDKPTFKQKMFARKYVELKGRGTQAAMEVYDVKKKASAKSLAHQNLDKPVVQQEIKKILEKSGLSLDNVSDKIKDAIDQGLDSGKATVDTALRGIDMVLKLHNAYPASRSMKLVYTKNEQVASKDVSDVLEELKKLNATTSSLIDDTT